MGSPSSSFWAQLYGAQAEPPPPDPSPWLVERGSAIVERLSAAGLPLTALEVGAGWGWDARQLTRLGLAVTALEGCEEAARAGALAGEGIPTVVADLCAPLPLPDASFGLVHCRRVLSCDFQQAQIEAALGELARILAPGGLLALTVRSTSDPTYLRLGARGAGWVSCAGVGLHFFSPRSLKRALVAWQLLELTEQGPSGEEGEATLTALARRA